MIDRDGLLDFGDFDSFLAGLDLREEPLFLKNMKNETKKINNQKAINVRIKEVYENLNFAENETGDKAQFIKVGTAYAALDYATKALNTVGLDTKGIRGKILEQLTKIGGGDKKLNLTEFTNYINDSIRPLLETPAQKKQFFSRLEDKADELKTAKDAEITIEGSFNKINAVEVEDGWTAPGNSNDLVITTVVTKLLQKLGYKYNPADLKTFDGNDDGLADRSQYKDFIQEVAKRNNKTALQIHKDILNS